MVRDHLGAGHAGRRRAIEFICLLLALVLAATGCVSKAKARAQAQAAFLAGRQAGAVAPLSQQPSVWIVGKVRNNIIPWSDDLTLAKAIVQADYQGFGDPGQIILVRNGLPTYFSPKELLSGKDIPLSAGDRVEIRP